MAHDTDPWGDRSVQARWNLRVLDVGEIGSCFFLDTPRKTNIDTKEGQDNGNSNLLRDCSLGFTGYETRSAWDVFFCKGRPKVLFAASFWRCQLI